MIKFGGFIKDIIQESGGIIKDRIQENCRICELAWNIVNHEKWLSSTQVRELFDRMDIKHDGELNCKYFWSDPNGHICPECFNEIWIRHPVKFYQYFCSKKITMKDKITLNCSGSMNDNPNSNNKSGKKLSELFAIAQKNIKFGMTWDEISNEERYPEDHAKRESADANKIREYIGEENEQRKLNEERNEMRVEKEKQEAELRDRANKILNSELIEEEKKESLRNGLTDEDLKNNFEQYSWQDLEDITGNLFKAKGYEVTVGVNTASGEQKRSDDGGIDVRAKNDTITIGIQVKKHVANVSFNDVTKTYGVGLVDNFNHVIIISAISDFTDRAKEFASKTKPKMDLWDKEKFKAELSKYILRI